MKKHLWIFSLLFFCASFVTAQRTVTGTIIDDLGDALIGANVVVKGTTIGTVTDIEGKYTLTVPAGNDVLVVSYTGYSTKDITLGTSNVLDVTMSEGVELSQVVVTGYNSTKRGDLVQSISTVSGEEITNLPIASVDNLLQGRSTGVEVTAINGKPGQNGYVRIRGLTSINGNNDPLFVVDGVPVPSAVYSAINPNDIESFSILKDAAATSIYGARASAGVVLITTKRGSEGNSYVEYSLQVGQNSALDDGFTLMNASQKLNYELALGVRGPLTSEARADILRYGTDWEDALLRDAGLMSHNLSFSGGSGKGNYFLSMSRFDNQGLSVGSDFDRTTAKFNGGYKINDWVEVSNSISIARRNDNELRDRNNVQSPFVGLYTYNPYETIYNLDENGEIIIDANGDPDYNFTSQGFNILEAQRNNPESREWSDIYGNLNITLTPIDGLRISSTGGYNYNTFRNTYFIKPNSILDFYVGDPDAPGIKRDSGSDRDRLVWTNTANYDYELNSKNSFSFMVGTEYIKDNLENYSISGKGFPVGLSVQDVAAEITNGFTRKNEFSLFSLFGQLGYSFDNNLRITGTVRRDGSSRFGSDNRYGTFWSVGAGYDFANAFLKDNNTFDQLKLRASYGTTGNEPTGRYQSIGILQFASYSDQTAAFQSQVANPTLQWETQKAYSVGIDYGILNNRITGSLEYYNKKSTDLLFPNQLSRTSGFSDRIDNIGDITNQGFEAEVYYSPVRNKDFYIDLGIRFSHNKTKVDKLNSTEEINPTNAFSSVLKEGEVAYVWQLVEFSRIDPATGDLLYFDVNGEETTSPTQSDSKILSGKSAVPTFWGGFDINVGFKGLTLNTQFAFKGGNYIYNQRRLTLTNGLDGARRNQSVEALDYWKQPGDVTDIPRPNVEAEASSSTRFLERGDFIRLRNVKLAYQLPTSVTDKIRMKNVSVFVAGSNLATFTNFVGDPEVGVFIEESVNSSVGGQLPGEFAGFSYPNTRSITGGVTVRF